MRAFCLLIAFLLTISPQRFSALKGEIIEKYASVNADRRTIGLPILFERNVGQSDPRVRFLSHASDATFFVTNDGAELVFAQRAAVHQKRTLQRQNTSNLSALRMRLGGGRDRGFPNGGTLATYDASQLFHRKQSPALA